MTKLLRIAMIIAAVCFGLAVTSFFWLIYRVFIF